MTAGLIKLDMDPANLDPDGICENQTTAGAAFLVLNGALCDLGTPLQFDIADSFSSGIGGVKLAFDSAGAINTVNFTIVGKDQDGNSITEVVTGVTTTAVVTTKFYSQVTSIYADAAVASNVFVGTVAPQELVSPTIPVNRYAADQARLAVTGKTGTCQWDLQQTFDNLRNGSLGATWFDVSSNQTADMTAVAGAGATGVRLRFDSYSDGAELQFHVNYNPYR